jgi:S1-C subfamily serine protease
MKIIFFIFVFSLINLEAYASLFEIESQRGDEQSFGVGFFVNNKGIALTSYHVVENSSVILAKIDHVVYNAEILGFDEVYDIALLKIDIANKNYYHTDVDRKVILGDVVKIDSIIGLQNGKIVQDGEYEYMVDIDIAQGFSGSPVLCKSVVCGVVVSLNTETNYAIVAKSSGFMQNYDAMINGATLRKKNIGLYVMDLTKDAIITLGFDFSKKPHGVLVTYSQNNKLKPWDVITHVDNTEIYSVEQLQNAIIKKYENETIAFQVVRNKILETVPI